MGLFSPAWMTKKPSQIDRAMREVLHTTDQRTLASIAREAHFDRVRLAAVQRLTDPAALEDIALNQEQDIASAAVRRITDTAALLRVAIARGDAHWHSSAREAAVNCIQDQTALADLVLSDEDRYLRRLALERVNDPQQLARIAAETNMIGYAVEALEPIWKDLPLAEKQRHIDRLIRGLQSGAVQENRGFGLEYSYITVYHLTGEDSGALGFTATLVASRIEEVPGDKYNAPYHKEFHYFDLSYKGALLVSDARL